jgi:hypothetical protein
MALQRVCGDSRLIKVELGDSGSCQHVVSTGSELLVFELLDDL